MSPSFAHPSGVLRREIRSLAAEVDDFCRDARELVVTAGHSDEIFPVELLLRESLNNAMIHGNGNDGAKRIRAKLRIGKKWILLSVADEGMGFDCGKTRNRAPDPDATCGRGLLIYALYANRVFFNGKGNHVCLWRSVIRENERKNRE
ncbi:MAG: ATP-binding protein [Syntrophobacteraceae bacterium]